MLRLLRCLGNMLRWLRDILAFFQATCLRDMLRCLGDMLRCMRDILDFLKVQYIGQLSQRVCQKIKFSFTVSPNLKNLSNTIFHTVHINMSLQKPLPLEMPWDYIPQTKKKIDKMFHQGNHLSLSQFSSCRSTMFSFDSWAVLLTPSTCAC